MQIMIREIVGEPHRLYIVFEYMETDLNTKLEEHSPDNLMSPRLVKVDMI